MRGGVREKERGGGTRLWGEGGERRGRGRVRVQFLPVEILCLWTKTAMSRSLPVDPSFVVVAMPLVLCCY